MAKSTLRKILGRKRMAEGTVASRAPLSSLEIPLAGTTTNGREAVQQLSERHGLSHEGYAELEAQLRRERDNPVDPQAVAVYVEGERIGYLPGYAARAIDLPEGAGRAISLQLFTLGRGGELRSQAYAWLGDGAPRWSKSEESRPPMTAKEKAIASHKSVSARAGRDIAAGGDAAARVTAASTEGIYFLEAVEPIKELKRQEKLVEALELCYIAIQGAEGAARRDGYGPPAPWYTEQAAIVHRKLGQRVEELEVLERYIAWLPGTSREQHPLARRLAKLQS